MDPCLHPLREKDISIHALREEGDLFTVAVAAGRDLFLSTPSARRATGRRRGWFRASAFLSTPSARRATSMRCFTLTAVIFLSTPSARRATRAGLPESAGRKDFYPRPPRGGRLVRFNKRLRKKQISIHALREEGDRRWRRHLQGPTRFLSTPSARRATRGSRHVRCKEQISIHALREEGDAVRPPFFASCF